MSDRIHDRLSKLEYELESLEYHVKACRRTIRDLGVFIVLGAILFASIVSFVVISLVDIPSESMIESSYNQGYAAGYRQGIQDALNGSITDILCKANYTAAITINGQEFTLSCGGGE